MSGRRRQRYGRERRLRRWVNSIVDVLNWVLLGQPADPCGTDPGADRLTSLQWDMVDLVRDSVRPFARRCASAWRGGRAALRDQV